MTSGLNFCLAYQCPVFRIRIGSGYNRFSGTKKEKKLRNFIYIQLTMLDPDPDSMNPDLKHYQYLPILESFSNSVCLLRMTGSSSPRSSVMFTMTVFSLLACAPMSRPYSDMESSLQHHRTSLEFCVFGSYFLGHCGSRRKCVGIVFRHL